MSQYMAAVSPAPVSGLSRRAERTIRALSSVAVLTLALAAAILSFSGLQTLALQAGFSPQLAWLLPVVIDGMVLTGSLGVVASNLVGISTWYPWSLTLLGVTASIAGNVVAAPDDLTSRLVHATGPLAFALSIEGMLRIYRASAVASAQREAERLARVEAANVPAVPARAVENVAEPVVVASKVVNDSGAVFSNTESSSPRTVREAGETSGLPTARERIVTALEEYPEATAAEIARMLGTDPSYTRKIVRSLKSTVEPQEQEQNENIADGPDSAARQESLAEEAEPAVSEPTRAGIPSTLPSNFLN